MTKEEKIVFVREYVKNNNLSYKWLNRQIERQFGIKIHDATLSTVVNGKHHPNALNIITACVLVLERYSYWDIANNVFVDNERKEDGDENEDFDDQF